MSDRKSEIVVDEFEYLLIGPSMIYKELKRYPTPPESFKYLVSGVYSIHFDIATVRNQKYSTVIYDVVPNTAKVFFNELIDWQEVANALRPLPIPIRNAMIRYLLPMPENRIDGRYNMIDGCELCNSERIYTRKHIIRFEWKNWKDPFTLDKQAVIESIDVDEFYAKMSHKKAYFERGGCDQCKSKLVDTANQ